MVKKKKTILFLGTGGFPFGSATIQRQIQLAKSLQLAAFKVIVINSRSPHSSFTSKKEKISIHGFYQGIEYLYCSLIPYRPANFFLRNIIKQLGPFLEFFTILYYRLFKNTKYIFYRTNVLSSLKHYYFISKIFRMELIYDYVELYDSVGERINKNKKESEISFDYNFYKYAHKLVIISDFLENHVKKIAPDKLMVKIPPIIDFSYFDSINTQVHKVLYFLYCGSAAYDDIIKFIIKAFVNSNSAENNYKLRLVINGNSDQLNYLNQYLIDNKYEESIELLSKLSYFDLVSYYKSASALLIPMSNNTQDQARFPFKICEYTASKRPIITSDTGVIKEFFEDQVNAFIAKSDSVEDFTNKLNLVVEQPKFADKIGINGYELGKNVFNYKSYSETLSNLILKSNH